MLALAKIVWFGKKIKIFFAEALSQSFPQEDLNVK